MERKRENERMGTQLKSDKTSVLDIKEELDWVDGFDDEPRHDKVMVGDWLTHPTPHSLTGIHPPFLIRCIYNIFMNMLHCNNIHAIIKNH